MPRKSDYEHMYLSHLPPEGKLPKGVILEALLRSSGDTVAAVKITLDGMDVWRDGKKVATVTTVREAFALAAKWSW